MDPKPSSFGMLLAPPPSGSSSAARFPAAQTHPRLDDHLVVPETREEVLRGHRIEVMPAKPPHADRHFKLDFVLGAHIRPGYVGSTELLTRTSETSDFATDTCVRKEGDDPATGERYLEELAFEIVNEQSLRDVTIKAEDLTARGVRRIVAVFVKKGEVGEWSSESRSFKKLDLEGTFVDPTLARPIKVKALLDAAEADDAVVLALEAKGNPALARLKAEGAREGKREGKAEGLREGILLACEMLGIELDEARRTFLAGLDVPALEGVRETLRRTRQFP